MKNSARSGGKIALAVVIVFLVIILAVTVGIKLHAGSLPLPCRYSGAGASAHPRGGSLKGRAGKRGSGKAFAAAESGA